jgi:translation initiation factor 2B subunit (eIF-2B alpha/beta/delta family)
VLTYSNSTTVTAVLHHARAEGHLDRVFLSEARPAYDGRPLARCLAEVGVEIDYSTDMGLFAKLREADLVVLGADAVFPLYFLNKIGTCALAELAQVRNVPLLRSMHREQVSPYGGYQLVAHLEAFR